MKNLLALTKSLIITVLYLSTTFAVDGIFIHEKVSLNYTPKDEVTKQTLLSSLDFQIDDMSRDSTINSEQLLRLQSMRDSLKSAPRFSIPINELEMKSYIGEENVYIELDTIAYLFHFMRDSIITIINKVEKKYMDIIMLDSLDFGSGNTLTDKNVGGYESADCYTYVGDTSINNFDMEMFNCDIDSIISTLFLSNDSTFCKTKSELAETHLSYFIKDFNYSHSIKGYGHYTVTGLVLFWGDYNYIYNTISYENKVLPDSIFDIPKDYKEYRKNEILIGD